MRSGVPLQRIDQLSSSQSTSPASSGSVDQCRRTVAFEGARKNLELVTNEMFNATKKNLFKKMNRLDGPASGTNAVPLKAEPK